MSRIVFALLLAALTTAGEAAEQEAEVHRLDNGLTVVLRPVEGSRQVALVVLYSLGGHQDPEGQSGLAHLIEHLYVTASAGEAKARSVAEYMQKYPWGWNAQTGDSYTVFASVFAKGSLERELQDAAWRMGDLHIEQSDLDREKPRLLAELANMFERVPALAARNLAREQVRPTPAGGRKGGVSEHVGALTLDDVRERWQRHYKPTNATVVVAGDIEADATMGAVCKLFAPLPPGGPAPASPVLGEAHPHTAKEVSVKAARPGSGPHACLAYAAPPPGDDLYAPFLILVGRMWRAMGPGNQPETIVAAYTPLDDPAWLGVTAAVGAEETADEAVARLHEFVAAALKPELQPVERQVTQNTFALFLGTADIPDAMLAQNVYAVAFSLGRRAQLGVEPQKLRKALASVTRGDLRRAAREIFAPERCASVVVVPQVQ